MTLYPPSNTDFPFKSSCTARAVPVARGVARGAGGRRAGPGWRAARVMRGTGVARGARGLRRRAGPGVGGPVRHGCYMMATERREGRMQGSVREPGSLR